MALPLAARIHEGVVFSNRDQRTLLDKMGLLLQGLALDAPCYFVADACYASRKVALPLPHAGHHLVTLVRFVAVVQPTRGTLLLMTTDLALDPVDVIRLYGYRFKIEVTFKSALRAAGAFLYHFWMKTMTPITRKAKDQYLHRKTDIIRWTPPIAVGPMCVLRQLWALERVHTARLARLGRQEGFGTHIDDVPAGATSWWDLPERRGGRYQKEENGHVIGWDVHRSVVPMESLARVDYAALWQRAKPGTLLRTPCLETDAADSFLLLCLHIAGSHAFNVRMYTYVD